MKKKLLLTLLLGLALCLLAACGSAPVEDAPEPEPAAEEDVAEPAAEPVELYVFAAASMNAALPEIAGAYAAVAPETELVFTFDSSGTLKTQITEGAYCDIFISAGQKQMNAIDKANTEVNTDGLDYILSDTRFNLLENQIVLVVPADNPADIQSFDDLATDKLSLLAIGNADVPVGQYAAEILTWMDVYDSLNNAGRITFGANTTEVTSQVSEGAVDCGIVYKTDVASSVNPDSLAIVAAAPEGSVSRAIYPAAIVNVSENVDAAQAFLDFLRGDEAKAILESYGFSTEF